MGKSCTYCGKPVDSHGAKGYCATCYQRYRRNGTADKRAPKNCSHCGDPAGRKGAKGYCGKCYMRWKRHGDPSISLIDRGHADTCSECPEPVIAKGYCTTHYQRWSKWGDPLISMQQVRGICAFPACGLPHDSHGYCTSHARQLRQGRDVRELLPRGTWTREVSERIAEHATREASRLGRPRRYALDETYFDQIDTPEKAYWLGFITADGCIGENAAGQPADLRIGLAVCDDGHLRKLCIALGSNRPVLYYDDGAVVTFGSRHLADSLGRLGVVPRKSLNETPWDGPPDLMPHYWRGLFDGDGTIFVSKGSWCVGICGGYTCVAAFGSWATGITNGRSQPRSVRKDTECWQWTCQGSIKSQQIATTLYRDAAVALERKLLLAQELCAIDFEARRASANVKRVAALRAAQARRGHLRATET